VPPDRPNTIGAGVALTLPFWSRNAGAIASADAQRDAAAREVRRVGAQVAADLVAARAGFEEAAQRWQRYRDELRPRSDSIRRAVSLAYEKGGASLVDLLQAQRNDNDVRLEAMRAANDVTVAAADLEAATTTASPEDSRP
jgi:cobalt-zinc-cadmium efflux system outer membrane protein